MVGQVMINLLHNAVDALRAAGSPRATLDVVAVREDDAVRIEVRDRGPGVPAELRQSVFRPGITTKEGHAGMGLALVSRYIEEVGGTIELRDAKPGARFIVRLPPG
jgi:C4-dicarboxylate-specific signal transduction histidine kinase